MLTTSRGRRNAAAWMTAKLHDLMQSKNRTFRDDNFYKAFLDSLEHSHDQSPNHPAHLKFQDEYSRVINEDGALLVTQTDDPVALISEASGQAGKAKEKTSG